MFCVRKFLLYPKFMVGFSESDGLKVRIVAEFHCFVGTFLVKVDLKAFSDQNILTFLSLGMHLGHCASVSKVQDRDVVSTDRQ